MDKSISKEEFYDCRKKIWYTRVNFFKQNPERHQEGIPLDKIFIGKEVAPYKS